MRLPVAEYTGIGKWDSLLRLGNCLRDRYEVINHVTYWLV
jgi:hypothetical protein